MFSVLAAAGWRLCGWSRAPHPRCPHPLQCPQEKAEEEAQLWHQEILALGRTLQN